MRLTLRPASQCQASQFLSHETGYRRGQIVVERTLSRSPLRTQKHSSLNDTAFYPERDDQSHPQTQMPLSGTSETIKGLECRLSKDPQLSNVLYSVTIQLFPQFYRQLVRSLRSFQRKTKYSRKIRSQGDHRGHYLERHRYVELLIIVLRDDTSLS